MGRSGPGTISRQLRTSQRGPSNRTRRMPVPREVRKLHSHAGGGDGRDRIGGSLMRPWLQYVIAFIV